MRVKKDKYLTILVSKKMFDDFTKECNKNEDTKSEVLRNCIKKYLAKSKG